MLEASGFDFRNRYPQNLVLKIAKHYHVDRDTVGRTAYNISLDLYRTFAPLKQTTATMAVACVELSGRICDQPIPELESGKTYERWTISRPEVMGMPANNTPNETLSDRVESRNAARSFGLVYSSSSIYHCRTRSCSRDIHQYTDCSQSGGVGPPVPTPFPKSQETIFHQWRQGRKRLDRLESQEAPYPDHESSRGGHERCFLTHRQRRLQARAQRRHGALHAQPTTRTGREERRGRVLQGRGRRVRGRG